MTEKTQKEYKKMFTDTQTSDTEFKKNFIIFSSVVSILVITILAIDYFIAIKEENARHLANTHHQQLALSQRVAFLSENIIHQIENPHTHGPASHTHLDTNNSLIELSEAVSIMKKNHVLLITDSNAQNKGSLSPALHNLYFGENTKLNESINDYIKSVESIVTFAAMPLSNEQKQILKNTYKEIHSAAEFDILKPLDQAVKISEEEADKTISILRMIVPILLLLSVMGLIFLWIVIFKPLNQKLQHTIKALGVMKEESKREKQRLDMATKGSSTGMWDWDIRAGVFYWSLSLQSLLGLKEEQGKIYDTDFFQTLLFDESRDGFNEAIKNHLKNKEPFYYEGKVVHRTKQVIWVSFRGQALWDDNDRAYRMLGSIEDITDKRQAEKERNIYIQGVENSGLPFAIMETESEKHNFIYVAKAFCDLTGYNKQKLVESNLNIFTGPETSMGDLDTIDSAIEQNIGIKTKILGYRIDGSSFWNEITMEPIFVEGVKKASYYAVIFNDLTESLLREEKEINRQRNESLGALAASVAHEINNLLMPMTMAKDVLESELKEDCDPFAIEQLETIDEYALQAKEIVTGVLTFSRKETGKLELANIYDLLNRSVAFIGNLLSTKTKITIEEPESDDIKNESSMVNLTEFRQIITNLAKNSEHAFDGKSGQITISLSTKDLSNQQRNDLNLRATEFIIIHFTDNGSGIPKDITSKIFDPLFTTKDVGHGTGLGLSVVHGIIRSWGGTIQVESTEGVGTKFDIYIPVAHNHDDFEYLSDLLDDNED